MSSQITAELFQFLSRSNVPNLMFEANTVNLPKHPEIGVRIDYEVCDKPFEINFAHAAPKRPSRGAHQYVDPELDKYMTKRWPRCIKGNASIEAPGAILSNPEMSKEILGFLHHNLWSLKDHPSLRLVDQLSTTKGYRRAYFHHQDYDFDGNRIPSSRLTFVPTNIGDFAGPGVISLNRPGCSIGINELVWSWIIPFKDPKGYRYDRQEIVKKLRAIRKHMNSYDELVAARRLILAGEIKACIRAAASAVDAILRFYCDLWGIVFPGGKMSYDKRIERILADAGKPSYREADKKNSERLLYLYSARNTMHEGDCRYRDASGKLIRIRGGSQAEILIRAAEDFTLWIDAIV